MFLWIATFFFLYTTSCSFIRWMNILPFLMNKFVLRNAFCWFFTILSQNSDINQNSLKIVWRNRGHIHLKLRWYIHAINVWQCNKNISVVRYMDNRIGSLPCSALKWLQQYIAIISIWLNCWNFLCRSGQADAMEPLGEDKWN